MRHNNYYDKILNYQNKFRSMVTLTLSIPKTYIFSKVCNNLGNYNTEYNVVRDN